MSNMKIDLDDMGRKRVLQKFEDWLKLQPNPHKPMFGRAGRNSPSTPFEIVDEVRRWSLWAQEFIREWVEADGIDHILQAPFRK